MEFLLYVICCFSYSLFIILYTVCLGVFLSEFVLCGALSASWVWWLFPSQVKTVWSHYLQIFSLALYLLLYGSFETPIMWILVMHLFYQSSLVSFSSFFFFFAVLFSGSDFHCSACHSTDSDLHCSAYTSPRPSLS